jgi:hypothetical protein
MMTTNRTSVLVCSNTNTTPEDSLLWPLSKTTLVLLMLMSLFQVRHASGQDLAGQVDFAQWNPVVPLPAQACAHDHFVQVPSSIAPFPGTTCVCRLSEGGSCKMFPNTMHADELRTKQPSISSNSISVLLCILHHLWASPVPSRGSAPDYGRVANRRQMHKVNHEDEASVTTPASMRTSKQIADSACEFRVLEWQSAPDRYAHTVCGTHRRDRQSSVGVLANGGSFSPRPHDIRSPFGLGVLENATLTKGQQSDPCHRRALEATRE